MSTYSNRLQPAVQNLLRVVQFFHPRSSCMMHISADVFGGRKSLVKKITAAEKNLQLYWVIRFFWDTEDLMHDDAYIGGRSVNNIKCVVHDDLQWKN